MDLLMNETICSKCGAECYTTALLTKHYANTSCKPPKPKRKWVVPEPKLSPLPWEEKPSTALYFSTLADRLADKFHQLSEVTGAYKGRWSNWRVLSTAAKVPPLRLKEILISRTAESLECTEADRILRALGLDLRCLLVGDDHTPMGPDWESRRDRVREIAAMIDTEMVELFDSVGIVQNTKLLPEQATTYMLTRLGSISQKLDAIRLTLKADWNPSKTQILIPKTKDEYRQEIRRELRKGKRKRKPT